MLACLNLLRVCASLLFEYYRSLSNSKQKERDRDNK